MLQGFVIGDRGLSAAGDTHPAWASGHGKCESYTAIGASAVGQLHLLRGRPRDDAFIVRAAGPWLALAVADGLGSRPLSRYGATYVVEALTALLLRQVAAPLRDSIHTGHSNASATPPFPSPPADIKDVDINVRLLRPPWQESREALGSSLQDWADQAAFQEDTFQNRHLEVQQSMSVGWWPIWTEALPAAPDINGQDPGEPEQSGGDAIVSSPLMLNPIASPPDEGEVLPLELLQERASVEVTSSEKQDARPDLEAIMCQAFEKTHFGLRAHADSLGLGLTDLGSTALALLLDCTNGRLVVGQVGDGALIGLTLHGRIEELVAAADSDDPNTTYTLNLPNFGDFLRVRTIEPDALEPFTAFFAMTDGLAGDLLYSPQEEKMENWAQIVNNNLLVSATPVQAATGLLNWLSTYQAQGSWDDRTLVVLTKGESDHGHR